MKKKQTEQVDYFAQAEEIWFQASDKEFNGDMRSAFQLYNHGVELAVKSLRLTKNENQMLIIANRIKIITQTIQQIEIKDESDDIETCKEDQLDVFDLYFSEQKLEMYSLKDLIVDQNIVYSLNKNIIQPLRYPSIYKTCQQPVLVYGLRGVGKSSLIKAAILESNAKYISLKQTGFDEFPICYKIIKQLANQELQQNEILGHKIQIPIGFHIQVQSLTDQICEFIQSVQNLESVQVFIEIGSTNLIHNNQYFNQFKVYRLDIPSIFDLEIYFKQTTNIQTENIYFRGITPGIILRTFEQQKHIIQKELFFSKKWSLTKENTWVPDTEGEEKDFGEIPYYQIEFPNPKLEQVMELLEKNKIKSQDHQLWCKQLKDLNLGICSAYDLYEE
ncbi:hypothetical protein SS50377_24398 [Spironucleus salmonicida]|uniref:Uncharacterized protein n=1 Tax=Spironucleus salmonicida TaxID=348837 RepID=V6LMY7_9EUKA|nr:hypothetical protein SS50377_24398 [Spironucleus salmonicida]|eukprot:EST46052.1 Hypothetical protein SS50377_14042 [Spironucleus salmonicida]